MSMIETKKLTKDYGSGRGIFDISLKIEQGEMLGLRSPCRKERKAFNSKDFCVSVYCRSRRKTNSTKGV